MNEWRRDEDWFWEGNIQSRIIEYMQGEEGFTILSRGQPGEVERGLEIVAERHIRDTDTSIHRIVTVRGWPTCPNTSPESQTQFRPFRPETVARSWIARAVLDLALARGSDLHLELALALPAVASYIRYIQRLRWFLGAARVLVYLIPQDGKVAIIQPGAPPMNALRPARPLPVLEEPSAAGETRRKLGLPGASRLRLPLLDALVHAGGELSRPEAIEAVARWFPELPRPLPAEFGQRVSVAQRVLQVAGHTEPARRGVWRITPAGRQVYQEGWEAWLLKEHPPALSGGVASHTQHHQLSPVSGATEPPDHT
jgi:hypothetical protein